MCVLSGPFLVKLDVAHASALQFSLPKIGARAQARYGT